MIRLFRTPFVLSACATLLFVGAVQAADEVQFNRDVRPILSDNCYFCHGPDPGQRKEGLRFDRREGFFDKRDAGTPVIPGNVKESTLIERIFSDDPDDIMPPPKSHKKLAPAQKELVKKWVEQGAKWEPHWSFIPPTRSKLPEVKDQAWVKNPVDSFILAKLETNNLKPAPEADRRTLARRVSLDLTGLPPTPAEVDAFVNDSSPDAYEKLVDKLLGSAHYGEHRGRYWLDAARYGDTHGIHVDNYREMWPYRDWVISAFNKNMPFDKFTIEQLAGDLLPDATLEQKIGSGFHRCNITTNEGGAIPDEYLAIYARDRVETTGEVWLGLTLGCAVCHDHKFDPISTKEFYQFTAFFRNTTQAALDGNIADTEPVVLVASGPDAARWKALPDELKGMKDKMTGRAKEIEPEFLAWVKEVRPSEFDHPAGKDKLDLYLPFRAGFGRAVWNEAVHDGAPIPLPAGADWQINPKYGPYLRFAKENTAIDVGDVGDVDTQDAFSYGAWIRTDAKTPSAAIIARMDEDDGFRGWDMSVIDGKHLLVHLVHHWQDNALKIASDKNIFVPGVWAHVFVTYDGSAKPEGVAVYVNGKKIATHAESNTLTGTIRTKTPTRIGARSKNWYFLNGGVQDVRFYHRKLSDREVFRLHGAEELRELAASPADTKDRDTKLRQFYVSTHDASYEELKLASEKLEDEQKQIRARNPVTHIMKEKETPPKAFVLKRGQYDQLGEEVGADVLSALNKLPNGAPQSRLGLAEWIVAPENPLMARVTVNRFWQEIFGTGLVRTSEDFGIMGENPSHPELLDWLAVEFRESGWDVKKMFKLIVMSSAYRQASQMTAEKIEKDPQNRLLSRGPRFRMDAEMVRDYALAASGLLVPVIGGPSVKPYQPEGVWEAVAMIQSNTRKYEQDHGDKLYRRSMYTFWKRSAPPASMEVFNAPSRETCTVRRERSDTPLQALVTLNDPQFIEAARHLAERALKEGGETNESRLDYIATRLLARPFRKEEMPIVKESFDKLSDYYKSHEEDAKKVIAIGESKADAKLEPQLLAAWTMAANELMNLDEVLNK